MNYLIVTRHVGLVEWLAQRGITGEVIAHATPDQVGGRHVVGALPMHLAASAASVMDAGGASLTRYVVSKA